MVLKFEVDRQILTRLDNEQVVQDSHNYLYAKLTYSEDWIGEKTMVFRCKSGAAYNALLDSNDTCLVPWEALTEDWLEVSAFCGDLITANVVRIYTLRSGYEIGQEGRIPSPDIYTQIIEKLNNLNAMEIAYDNSESGLNADNVKEALDELSQGGGSGSDLVSCTFVHEAQYVACVGAEFNLYFDNICKTRNNAKIYFTASSSNNSIPITVYEERFSITPIADNVGTSTITIAAKRKDTDETVASTTLALRVVAKTALERNVRVILIGDSITNGGWNYNLPSMMDVTFYGTLGTSPRNHEGRVSWKASDYCTKETYNTYTNPFYNSQKAGTIKFDFDYYIENHPSYADVDYVNIMLGVNDGFDTDSIQYIKAMVDSILDYNNSVRVTVSFAYQKGYQLWEKDRKNITNDLRVHVFAFDSLLRETFSSYERVDLIPTFINSDNIYDHGSSEVHVSTRNTDFTYPVYVADRTHFTVKGYYKIGDVFYNYINYLTSIHPLPVDPSVVDKTVLGTGLTNANTLISNTTISVDGSDVSTSDYWCTQAAYDTYEDAIDDAQTVYDDADATQSEVDDAVSALSSATTTFNSARQPGSASPGYVRPDSARYYVAIHNTTNDTYLYIGWKYPSADTYYPTSYKITKNSGNQKVFVSFTYGGTQTGYAWSQYTSQDGTTWEGPTDKTNNNQWEITSYVGYNDSYEVIDSVMHS